jgi:hypothetical protein
MCFCDLWMAILVSTGAVLVASVLVCVVLPFHKGDYKPLPAQAELTGWLARQAAPAGRYMVPWWDPASRTPPDPDSNQPRAVLLVQYGPMSMGKLLLTWVVHLLVLETLVAYAVSIVLPHGADGMTVFRLTSVVALLAYGGGVVPRAIWEGVPWKQIPAGLLDAALYAVATGAIFLWLWPQA